MHFIQRKLRDLFSIIRFLFFFIIGFIPFYFFSLWHIDTSSMLLNLLYILIDVVILLLVAAFLLSEWFKQEQVGALYTVHRYSKKALLFLFIKTFIVVSSGYTLATMYLLQADSEQITSTVFFLTVVVFLSLYAIGSIFKGERLRELNMHAIQSENKLLKTQLNPHFLYNTLNNIDALIAYDTEGASQAVITLSSLMRYLTYQANKREVSLLEEVNHIKEYVALQRLRFESEQFVSLTTQLDEDYRIPPMLLMPLVENCFKHASNIQNDAAIQIQINVLDDVLQITTQNSFDPAQTQKPQAGGLGLQTLKRRLDLLFPDRHQFSTRQDKDVFFVTLEIELSH